MQNYKLFLQPTPKDGWYRDEDMLFLKTFSAPNVTFNLLCVDWNEDENCTCLRCSGKEDWKGFKEKVLKVIGITDSNSNFSDVVWDCCFVYTSDPRSRYVVTLS